MAQLNWPTPMLMTIAILPVRWACSPWAGMLTHRTGPGPAWRRSSMGWSISRAAASSHDGGGDRSQTVAALPQIIEKLKARGYKFVTADQMDGTITNVYQPAPQGAADIGLSLLSIASFRLWASGHTVVIWSMIVLGLLSMIRILLSWPLASSHRRRARKSAPSLDLDLDERSGDESHRLSAASRHTVSILSPAHNEEATLAKTINALNHVRGRIEQIIVVENGSTDATVDVAHQCASANADLPITVREFGPVGKAAALNMCSPRHSSSP